jgi:hypothetical protein
MGRLSVVMLCCCFFLHALRWLVGRGVKRKKEIEKKRKDKKNERERKKQNREKEKWII